MEELFVSYEVAIRLKEKGFDELCLAFYHNTVDGLDFMKNKNTQGNYVKIRNYPHHGISAPLYQQVIDWLRNKHNLYIEIRIDYSDYTFCINSKDHNNKRLKELRMNFGFKEYYETVNKAIEESLKLI